MRNAAMKAQVHPFFHAGSNTFSYVVSDLEGGHAAIIDPVLDFDAASARTGTTSAQAIVDHVNAHALAVQWILETHAHADHLSAAQWLKQQFPDARLAIGEGIRTVQATFAPVLDLGAGFRADGSQFDHLFTDGEEFTIGTLPARVIAVPGHTSDSNAFLVGDALFPGDSLFMPDGGTARCDFPGGDAATLFRSIRRLFELPDATRVFVCHDYGPGGREIACETSIGEQRARNIHVHDGIDEASFVTLRTTRDASLNLPALILPSLQVNLRAGALPDSDANGVRYLKLPLDRF
jgi:glyoxylase-like metal-dependent hydrolase (beta-lactamase superfamily II)